MIERKLPLEDSFGKTADGIKFKDHIFNLQRCLYVVAPKGKDLPYMKQHSLRGSSSAFHAIKTSLESRKSIGGLALYYVDTSKLLAPKQIVLEDSVRTFGNIYSADFHYELGYPNSSNDIQLFKVETDSRLSSMFNRGYQAMLAIAHMSNNGNSQQAATTYHDESINLALKTKLVQHRTSVAMKKQK